MQFSYISAALLASAASVFAQTSGFDPITKPAQNEVVPAGAAYSVTWEPSAPAGKISLVLLQGASNTTLQLGDTIVSGISSTDGSYSWNVPTTLTSYAVFGIKLELDSDTATFQYSNPFTISGLASTSSTVTQTVSQVSTPPVSSSPTTALTSAPSSTVHNSSSSSSTSAGHSTTLSTVGYSNATTTVSPTSKTTSTAVVVTSASRTSTTPITSATVNAASGLVAGSGAGAFAVAMALFL